MALYAIDGTESERKHRSNVFEFARRYRCPYVGNARFFSGPSTPAASYGAGGVAKFFGVGSRHLVNTVVDTIAKDRKRYPNLPLDLIGFSRGAAIANEVAFALSTKGILLEKHADSSITDIPSIRFLGLFDPVHSMGFPIPVWNHSNDSQGWKPDRLVFLGNRRWCTDKVPDNVKSVFIIYARDEARLVMRPSDLHHNLPTRGHIRNHILVPGVHSEAGGHVAFNKHLSDYALREMVRVAVSVDVPVSTWGLITDQQIKRLQDHGKMTPQTGFMGRDRLFWY